MSNLDEQQLENELQTKVDGARVVKIAGAGFYAIIPHYPTEPKQLGAVGVLFVHLGDTYTHALNVMRNVYHTQPVD